MADFIYFPFYDLFQENGHVPEIRKTLAPLLAGIRGSVLEIGRGNRPDHHVAGRLDTG